MATSDLFRLDCTFGPARSSTQYGMALDPTYAWFLTNNVDTGAMVLHRMRLSDNKLILPNGTEGTAGLTVTSYNMSQSSPIIAANGKVYVGSSTGLRVFSASDMSYLGQLALASYSFQSSWQTYFDGTYYYLGAGGTGNHIIRFHPATETLVRLGTWAATSGSPPKPADSDGTYLYMVDGYWVRRFDFAGNLLTSVDVKGGAMGNGPNFWVYDPESGYFLWAWTGSSYGIYKTRASDLAAINPNNTVTTYGGAHTGSSTGNGAGAAVVIDGWLYFWGASGMYRMQPALDSNRAMQALFGVSSWYYTPWGTGASSLKLDPANKRLLMGMAGWVSAGLGYTRYASATPTMTAAQATGTGTTVDLTFDLPVSVSPTVDVGSKQLLLQVTGASNTDSSTARLLVNPTGIIPPNPVVAGPVITDEIPRVGGAYAE